MQNKSIRQQQILEILGRHGCLLKNELDEKYSRTLQIELDENIRQKIRRDLKELYDAGKIERITFDRVTEKKILDYEEGETNKNVVHKWAVAGYLNSISGAKLVASFGAQIEATTNLQASLSLKEGIYISDFGLRFSLGNRPFFLKVEKDEANLRILVRRMKDNDLGIEELSEKLGRRLVVISLPFQSISASKSIELPGHALIEIKNGNDVFVSDLKSTNGVELKKISASLDHSNISLLVGGASIGSTVDIKTLGRLENYLELVEVNSCETPALVTLGKTFPVLIF